MDPSAVSPGFDATAASEVQDLIMSSDTETPTLSLPPPPPRTNTRTCRSSSTRRKSSAASSRRNSVSSLHSNRSSRGGNGVMQHRHLAQDLRRASILEDQKARQAARAAHADKVRLRAALAKSAPRTSGNREDRALAAQQARERYLAQVAASCAEEVKRAKRIAKDVKEKKAAEQLKMQRELEERRAEAERKRPLQQQQQQQQQQNSSTHRPSLLPVEENKMLVRPWKLTNKEAAAKVIQKAWRAWRFRKSMAEFLALRLTVTDAKTSTFEDLSQLIVQPGVVTCTERLLDWFGLPDAGDSAVAKTAAVRVFLASFLVVSHPDHVFHQQGEQEDDLIAKAKDMLLLLESVLGPMAQGASIRPPPKKLVTLLRFYTSFQAAFTAWKNHDASFLIETMIAQFVELDAIWQTVQNDTDGNVAADYSEGIKLNQTLLLVRLKRLVGPERARKMLREAVNSRRARSHQKPREIKPRSMNEIQHSVATANPPERSNSQPDLGRSMQLDQLSRAISAMPENRTIVHELAINNAFRIEMNYQSELRTAVKDAVYASMRRGLSDGHGQQWTIAMGQMIRDRLLRLVSPRNALHGIIAEGLDTELIASQTRNGTFSYQDFFGFMNTILPKICAPVRDEAVKALAADESTDYIERLAKLMHILDLLVLDQANHHLQFAAPMLIQNAAAYEQKCFREGIRNGSPAGATPKTVQWWRHARSQVMSEHARPAHAGSANQLTSEKIYAQALTETFISLPRAAADDPETLKLDLHRIEQTRSDVLRIITISTILLTAKNLLKRDVRAPWKQQAQRMWDLPDATLFAADATPCLTIIESVHVLPPATRLALVGTIEHVLAETRGGRDVAQPVMRVLLAKIRAYTLARLRAGSAEERLRSRTSAAEVLAAGGLVEFVGRIVGITELLEKVRRVDWEAHGEWLDRVADLVAQADGSDLERAT